MEFWDIPVAVYDPRDIHGITFRKNPGILGVSHGYSDVIMAQMSTSCLGLGYPTSKLFVIWISCIYLLRHDDFKTNLCTSPRPGISQHKSRYPWETMIFGTTIISCDSYTIAAPAPFLSIPRLRRCGRGRRLWSIAPPFDQGGWLRHNHWFT